jgi:hypothetical protein
MNTTRYFFVRESPDKPRLIEVIGDFDGKANLIIKYDRHKKQITSVCIDNDGYLDRVGISEKC